ncbi:hypothetical protein [Nodosilinea sp. P-1105]|uniref:hypothetical protein n=1 Tax=Nodosilinea sp. P-1105 TaxID=2546229 RepID=UPI00146D5544|nr:hypothetical protein [Nodosilinea sp. P-1105]
MDCDDIHSRYLERLRVVLLQRWWLTTVCLWLTVGSLSLWSLRHEIAQVQRYFTWAAVRYALAYNRLAALGLGLCVGLTVALLVNESRHILWGLSREERRRLERLLQRIQHQGNRHPLWQPVFGPRR